MTRLDKGGAPAAAPIPVLGRADDRAALAGCAASLERATHELRAAETSRDRARWNRARIAVDRLRQRYEWLGARLGQTDGVPLRKAANHEASVR